MTLVYACIAPHGSETIAVLASKSSTKKFRKTREGLYSLARDITRVKPDTIVIATPHNLKLWKKIAVVTAENSTGTLQGSTRNKRSISLKLKCDTGFARKVLDKATKKHLPVVDANYGTAEGTASDMPMDWGTLVPLWFMVPKCRPKPKIVIVTPSREIPNAKNFEFGKLVGELSERVGKRIAFVASADQAHRHRLSGPYGFNRSSKEYDRRVVRAIENNEIASIMNLSRKLVDDARPDSFSQITMLAGALDGVPMRARLVSYDVPTYFGMICASFQRN